MKKGKKRKRKIGELKPVIYQLTPIIALSKGSIIDILLIYEELISVRKVDSSSNFRDLSGNYLFKTQ